MNDNLPRSAGREERPDQSQLSLGLDGEGMCILLVEDNPDVAEFAYNALKGLNYGVIHARNVDEAIAQLEDDHERFSVVFTDVVMPGRSGVELGNFVRQRFPTLPVILTSGYSELLIQEPNHGFKLLRKPYSLSQLANMLAEVCMKG